MLWILVWWMVGIGCHDRSLDVLATWGAENQAPKHPAGILPRGSW